MKSVNEVKSDAFRDKCTITDGDLSSIKAVSYNGIVFYLSKGGGEYHTQNFIGFLKVLEYQKRIYRDTPPPFAFAEDDARLLTLIRTPLIEIDA